MELSLNGAWEFQWTRKGADIPAQDPRGRWLGARVPGDVHLDLMAHRLLEEPLHGLRSFEAEKVEDRVWLYRRRFDFAAPTRPFRARLIFGGLDCVAAVYLNGRLLGRTENAFVRHCFDVTEGLSNGPNEILVKITNGLEEVESKELARYLADKRELHRVWLRKPQFSFGWDWAPRLITCGIWREVRLEVTRVGFVDDLYARAAFSRDCSCAAVEYSFRFTSVAGGGAPAEAVVRVLDRGRSVAEEKTALKRGIVRGKLHLQAPRPWWPAGEGEQPLYELEVSLAGAGRVVRKTSFGVRRVRIVERAVREGGKTFAFEINGRKVFCRGANWVPADSIVARVDDGRIDLLLEEAVRCNFNMLRVWGGGIYESPHFYNRCDELGIMVWQDFMYACALYPDDDPAFLENCTREAEHIIKELRNHPCIVAWCGNNEVHDAWFDVYQRQGADRLYGGRIWDEALLRLVRRLAKGAIYRPASPHGGSYHRSELEGDCHSLQPCLTLDERTDIWQSARAVGRFFTEFYTWQSPPDIESMRRYLPEGELSQRSKAYRHHANALFEVLEKGVAGRYVSAKADSLPLEVYVNAMQRLHGEHMALLVESYRRNVAKCGGALFWMYNDCWPTSSWTTHDYYGRRKALYYYMKRAFAPITVSLLEEESAVSVWVSNLSDREFRGTVRYGRYAFAGAEKRCEWVKDVRVKAGASARVGLFCTTLTWPWENLASFAYVRLEDAAGTTVATASKLFASYKGLSGEEFCFPPSFWADQSVQPAAVRPEPYGGDAVAVTTDVPAFSVRLQADESLPEDNYFDLMPGERKIVRFLLGRPKGDVRTSSLNDVIIHLRNAAAEDGPR
ncbi:MAG: sugar-binding domain-containing protein [Planctomycetota bacterium]